MTVKNLSGPKLNINRRKIGSITGKHFLAVKEYRSSKKIFNMLHCELEKRQHRQNLSSMPFTATIDITNICTLQCPGCPTGLRLKGREKNYIDLQLIEKFLSETGDYLFLANLYNWGESLLHPSAAAIIELFHKRRIFTSISSHLNVKFSALQEAFEAGLDHLIISADGFSESGYQKYRKGGNWGLLLENLEKINHYKRSSGKTKPVVEWQTLSFQHLETELPNIYDYVSRMGVDWITVRGPMAPDNFQPGEEDLKGSFYGGKTRCDLLWHNVTLQSDGGIVPCCFLYHQEDDFGNIKTASVAEVRNNELFQFARGLFDKNKDNSGVSNRKHPCLKCPVVHKQFYLSKYLRQNPYAVCYPGFMAIPADQNEIQEIKSRFNQGEL